jgi:hypothetical protein
MQKININKESGLFSVLTNLGKIIPLINQVVQKAKKYDFEDINPELLINTKGEAGPRALRQQTQYQLR